MSNSIDKFGIIICILLFYIYLYSCDLDENIEKINDSNIVVIADNKKELIIKENDVQKTINKTCTHMGCLVKYDKDSQKLICPCHNSEFSLTGKVLTGPAKNDLSVTINESFVNNKFFDW